MNRKREIFFFREYFDNFYTAQNERVKKKILWTLKVIQELDRIPDVYIKHLKSTSGLYEIRVQVGNNIFRVFCFFDMDNLIVVGHGFQKKNQKTPRKQIERAEKIKAEYYESKK